MEEVRRSQTCHKGSICIQVTFAVGVPFFIFFYDNFEYVVNDSGSLLIILNFILEFVEFYYLFLIHQSYHMIRVF